MQCRKCAAKLPEGSQFCLKCGEPVTSLATRSASSPAIAPSLCDACGSQLAEGAQFCLKCGRPVASPGRDAEDFPVVVEPPAAEPRPVLPPPQHKRHVAVWILLLAGLITLIAWLATSDNAVAQQVQEFAGWKRDQTILDTPVSVAARGFQDVKFSLPEGSVNVAVVGEFKVAGGNQGASRRKDKGKDDDHNIEVYVLTEPAFAVWQDGYTTGSLYESGRVAEGSMDAELPAGAGVYYLVFSNKFAPKAPKTVQATVQLRYRSWLPESIRRLETRVRGWLEF